MQTFCFEEVSEFEHKLYEMASKEEYMMEETNRGFYNVVEVFCANSNKKIVEARVNYLLSFVGASNIEIVANDQVIGTIKHHWFTSRLYLCLQTHRLEIDSSYSKMYQINAPQDGSHLFWEWKYEGDYNSYKRDLKNVKLSFSGHDNNVIPLGLAATMLLYSDYSFSGV